MPGSSRRLFLAGSLGTLGVLAASRPVSSAALHPEARNALDTLMAGNARFVADRAICPPLTARRLELAEGQSPFAIVVSCSDSRVPVETVFDQIPGNIFGVRVAGNFVDEHGLGSIEYSVAVLKSTLILVLGHTHCGAVKATVQYVKDAKPQPSHIQSLVNAIEPAAKAAKGEPGDWVENATIANVKESVANLPRRSTIVEKAVSAKQLSIAGGVYHLDTGRVTIVT
ncbi:MAG TPA: carbonic anhydrase [Candidatus Aquilonibacter sp.]|nr:carbonic anhydrase [Candidatus Aquilonibacter sp.]